MDEVFYHDGQWYVYKPAPLEIPPFEFASDEFRMRDYWKWRGYPYVNIPGPLWCLTSA